MHTNYNFSFSFREKRQNALQNTEFDLLIIGGGITGAGIAFDAVNRGLKVALIEKDDFASGTSSRSTKLVHGGLRYLAQMQFRFVVQLGKERKILHQNNANNVIPIPMLLPIYKGGKLKKNVSLIALKIYDQLAGVLQNYKTQWIPKAMLLRKYPFIKTDGLKGALLYYEYKTNDGRMVIELLKKAAQKGLIATNHFKAQAPIIDGCKIKGIHAIDTINNKKIEIRAKVIVNASGAWCEKVLHDFKLSMPKKIYHSKGIHIVIRKELLPLKDAFYFDSPDHRMIFAIPKQNHVYIGTTDTPHSDALENPESNIEDISYLIDAINKQFPEQTIRFEDIKSCWAGYRSLIKTNNNKANEVSRKEEIHIDENGLISITGGKLTGYRLMAKKVVDITFEKLNIAFVDCDTSNIPFSGSEWDADLTLDKLVELADHKYDEAKQTGISNQDFKTLFYRYGTNIDILIEKAYEWFNKEKDPELLWLKTEIWYAIHFEMVGSLSSFFIYRTEMILFDKERVEKTKDIVFGEMASYLEWTDEQKQKELASFEDIKKNYQV